MGAQTPEAAFPPDLARVVSAWVKLPDAIRTAIVVLVRAAEDVGG